MGGEAGDDCVYLCSREEAVGQGQELAGFPAHSQMAGKEPVHVVQDAAFCNGLGAPDAFLRRLEDDLYDTGEILTDGVQGQADEKPQGSVAIVAAGVHASAVFRRKAIFYRKAAGVHILAHIVAVDIKAQSCHWSWFPVSITAIAPVKPSISLMIPASAPWLTARSMHTSSSFWGG